MTDLIMADDIEELARHHAGNDFRERRTVTAAAVDDRNDAEWTIREFIARLTASVPEQYIESAKVKFEGNAYDHVACLRVLYDRPETDEEMAYRVDAAISYAKRLRAQGYVLVPGSLPAGKFSVGHVVIDQLTYSMILDQVLCDDEMRKEQVFK